MVSLVGSRSPLGQAVDLQRLQYPTQPLASRFATSPYDAPSRPPNRTWRVPQRTLQVTRQTRCLTRQGSISSSLWQRWHSLHPADIFLHPADSESFRLRLRATSHNIAHYGDNRTLFWHSFLLLPSKVIRPSPSARLIFDADEEERRVQLRDRACVEAISICHQRS